MKVPKCRLPQFTTSAIKVERKHTHDAMFIVAENNTKNILMKCVSALSSTATGRIPIE